MGVRFATIIGVFVLVYSLLLFKLYDIQLIHGGYFAAKSASQELAASDSEAKRGQIYLTYKSGERLAVAINKDFPLVYAVPKDIDDPSEVAHRLAPVIGVPLDELMEKLGKGDDPFELLTDEINEITARYVDELKIKGVYTKTEPHRFYPLGTLAAHVLGYVGPASSGTSRIGHYGIEKFNQELLEGISGKLNAGKFIPSASGQEIALTIEPNIQLEAEKILASLVEGYKAAGGLIIVQEPNTGKILSLAARPNFDPNRYSESSIANFKNPAIEEIYEPGSIFKVLTMAAGIDSGKLTPNTTYMDTGSVKLNGRLIQNYDLKTKGPYGRVTMTNVIEHSINTGAVYAERLIGRDIFKDYLERFGFGEKTGIDLPGELAGDLRRLSPKEKDIAFATASYGQGVAATPLEVINAVSAIANGGSLMRPYLNAELGPEVIRTVMRPDTADQVAKMMISAVDKAAVAKIEGYRLAGKTGTAYIPDFVKGGYTDQVINTYGGFGPTSDPKFTILIKLDKPAGAPVAALTVVPAFRDLAEFILNYYNIPPDRLGDDTSGAGSR